MCWQNRQDNFYNSGNNKFFPGVLNFGGFPQYKNAPESSGSNVVFDLHALAFIAANEAAGGLLEAATKLAINGLFLNLKGIGDINTAYDLFTDKIVRFWPMVGTVLLAQAIDVKLNIGLFSGGWVQSHLGADSNGVNAFFDSGVQMAGLGDNWGHGGYLRSTPVGEWIQGEITNGYTSYNMLRQPYFPDTDFVTYTRTVSGGTTVGDANVTRSAGSFRIAGDKQYACINSASTETDPSTPVADADKNYFFGGVHLPGPTVVYAATQYSSMYLTINCSALEFQMLQTIDQHFQVQLGRNV